MLTCVSLQYITKHMIQHTSVSIFALQRLLMWRIINALIIIIIILLKLLSHSYANL